MSGPVRISYDLRPTAQSLGNSRDTVSARLRLVRLQHLSEEWRSSYSCPNSECSGRGPSTCSSYIEPPLLPFQLGASMQ